MKIEIVPGFGNSPFSSFPSSPSTHYIDFQGILGRCGQNGHLIIGDLGVASHYCNVARDRADPVPQLTDLKLAKEGDVAWKDAKFAQLSRRYNNVHHFAENFSLRRYYFERKFFRHNMLTIFFYQAAAAICLDFSTTSSMEPTI